MCYWGEKVPFDVIICLNLMKELQMDVLYSEYVLVWEIVGLSMQKIHNVKCTDLNWTYQEDT